MPAQIQVGVPTTLSQNVTYAVPARRCWIISVGAALQFSSDGSTWSGDIAATSTSGAESAGAFTRSTSSNTIIVAKPF